ncbi:uncharacterized protein LOC113503562 [Trichoplusia ni]|uniref:Uncharacterized protein LOC113503562 n=1 Tax=Trichoplusia ni TaxID=7111 RepID=A0A7E5WM19_TRINI|nr:uncharacterized protein LOC113503562 [Trichoplusia ni]
MILFRYFLTLFVLAQTVRVSAFNFTIRECPNDKTSTVFVRKRRHLAFPTGSAATVTTSIVKTFMTHVPSGWFTTIEAELVYHLPDDKIVSAHLRRKLHHRQKKEIWESLRNMFEYRNMNGRNCVMRTICEAQTHLALKGKSLVHDLLRAMFTAPLRERDFVEEMGLTYGEILEPDICDRSNDCPFSVIGFILDLNKHN